MKVLAIGAWLLASCGDPASPPDAAPPDLQRWPWQLDFALPKPMDAAAVPDLVVPRDCAFLSLCDLAGTFRGTVDYRRDGGAIRPIELVLAHADGGSGITGTVDGLAIDRSIDFGTSMRLEMRGGSVVADVLFPSSCAQLSGALAVEGSAGYPLEATRRGAPDGGLVCGP